MADAPSITLDPPHDQGAPSGAEDGSASNQGGDNLAASNALAMLREMLRAHHVRVRELFSSFDADGDGLIGKVERRRSHACVR